ncbi:MAG: DUF2249 domain-containing protein [Nocardioidaceae bacterium]
MSDVVIATNQDDAIAAERVEQHHAEMAGALDTLVRRVMADAASRSDDDSARMRLADWCRTELLPHAAAEETTLYAAARDLDRTRLLVEAMTEEHRVIAGLVAELEQAPDAVRAAASARALQVLFETHLAKENDRILPALVSSPDTSVAQLLSGMHEILGGGEHHTADDHAPHTVSSSHGEHGCGCGHAETDELPELDARAVPHAIRHATIFGALEAVSPGGGMVLIAPHDPVPLLTQLEERSPGRFAISYIEQGPQTWRLRFTRRG